MESLLTLKENRKCYFIRIDDILHIWFTYLMYYLPRKTFLLFPATSSNILQCTLTCKCTNFFIFLVQRKKEAFVINIIMHICEEVNVGYSIQLVENRALIFSGLEYITFSFMPVAVKSLQLICWWLKFMGFSCLLYLPLFFVTALAIK